MGIEMEFSDEDIRLDRSELKVLASDTRVEILRNLKSRNYTVSELAQKLGHSKSTMHEHLSRLLGAELVETADNYTDKWVYYRLTRRGKSLFVDSTKRVVVIISTILLILGAMQLAIFFSSLPLMGLVQQPMYVATGAEAEEAPPPEAIAKTYQIEAPSADQEQRVGTKQEAGAGPAGTPMPKTRELETEEIPYYFVGGVGFICAAFILAHYYHSRPPKLNVARKRKK